mmetsp:Transcript_99067/g.256116  ORF Transcript_99067/g.256116 Transcript_99067/m.256116 type:complete len:237 (-) Transcript_99067:1190-1900(-)
MVTASVECTSFATLLNISKKVHSRHTWSNAMVPGSNLPCFLCEDASTSWRISAIRRSSASGWLPPKSATPLRMSGSIRPMLSCPRTSRKSFCVRCIFASNSLRTAGKEGRSEIKLNNSSPPSPWNERCTVKRSACVSRSLSIKRPNNLVRKSALCHRGSWSASKENFSASAKLASTSPTKEPRPSNCEKPSTRKFSNWLKLRSIPCKSASLAMVDAGALRRIMSVKVFTARPMANM